ncbi:hypothetical protein [Lentzea cavernae]|uniref:hypothetical protein n=1 Tax=Lentzea cavernae TaxID=2020703 RepID=UPI0017491D04|nr:hypothetical protein [Lentzea cavernae]
MSSRTGDTFALYVRDALGLSTPTADAVPPLNAPVPRVHDVYVPETFGPAWDRWWTRAVESGGALTAPSQWPVGPPAQLRAAYDAWHPAPTSPGETTRRDRSRNDFGLALKEAVGQLTTELGHEPVFDLNLIEIPVRGQFWRRTARRTVLVSDELRSSRNVLAPLESVIRDLAQ